MLAACQQAPVIASPKPTAAPSPSTSPLAACPSTAALGGPQLVVRNLPAPDDLALGLDARLYFSDITAGTVSALNPDGSVERIAGGMSAPEGIVVQDDGRILVAEQGRNRVVAIDPQTHAVSQWHAFPNRTGRDGIDGIGPVLPGLDALGNLLPTGGNVIVPDSPNGVVWRVTADGKTATQIAGGMVRPVGAAVDTNGRIFVADEGGALWVLDPPGFALRPCRRPMTWSSVAPATSSSIRSETTRSTSSTAKGIRSASSPASSSHRESRSIMPITSTTPSSTSGASTAWSGPSSSIQPR